MAQAPKVGQTIELNDGRIAWVRFVGSTHFSDGTWVGVELQEPTGKNDGAVQGERYFDVEPLHGMFVRPPAVAKIIQQAPPARPAGVANGAADKRRPSSTQVPLGRRQSTLDTAAAKRQSINGTTPTPASRGASTARSLRSPTKSPTKPAATSSVSSRASTPRSGMAGTGTPVRPAASVTGRPRSTVTSRTSMAPPPAPSARPGRQSLAPSSNLSVRSGSGSSTSSGAANKRLSLKPSALKRLASGEISNGEEGSGKESSPDDKKSPTVRSPPTASPPTSGTPETGLRKGRSPLLSRGSVTTSSSSQAGISRTASSTSGPTKSTASSTAASREIEELKTKLRMMEKRRMEDREKLKSLDHLQAERDKFENIIQKLQTKYQPQQQEITDLRKQLKETETRLQETENLQAESEIAVEMAALDREMAEEMAEAAKMELETLKQKTEELELEVEVLREENQELGQEMSPEERTSQGWLQMERNNERLREALLRLRDLTQEQEAELRDQIKSLEADVQDLSGVKDEYEIAKQKLAQSESNIEDLRQQLDTALGAEDMIEELTEKNMSLSEQLEELKAAIEDLESLKELNDELEINHIETEKQMQEEIDYKDSVITEQAKRSSQQEEAIEDFEYTIARFRELVTSLQTDLEDMRASQQITETEAEELTNRSRAMMDLNMKLQVSAAKTQDKTIDLELRRLEAQEAAEHLAIVQLFLPESFNNERDSVLALLRFRRVGFKSNLLHGFVKERAAGQARIGHDDDIFAACEVLDKLTWVSTMCDRFTSCISSCSIEQFARFEGALYELEPVERALNGWIDGLRRDELKEKQCAEELQRTMALMSHLSEIHISENLASYADDLQMRTLMMQSYLESTALMLSQIKLMAQNKVPPSDNEDDPVVAFIAKIETLTSHTRSAKVVIGKAVRSLEDLRSRSLSLPPDTLPAFETSEKLTAELSAYARQIGFDLCHVLNEEGRSEPYSYSEISSTIFQSTRVIFPDLAPESEPLLPMTNKLRSLTNSLVDVASLSSDLSNTLEFERPAAPWAILSQNLHAAKTVPQDTEAELHRLQDLVHERATQLKLRETIVEEQSVKIELLEARTREAGKRAERIKELETILDEARQREKDLGEAIDVQSQELAEMERERERWRKIAQEQRAVGDAATKANLPGEAVHDGGASKKELEIAKHEVLELQHAIRCLREDNRRLQSASPSLLRGPNVWVPESVMRSQMTMEEEYIALLLAEGRDILQEMIRLTTAAKMITLSNEPRDRLAWRPAKTLARYRAFVQREEYQTWKAWKEDAVQKAKAIWSKNKRSTKGSSQRGGKPIARVDLTVPSANGSKAATKGLKIVRPEEWEELKATLGLARSPLFE